MYLPLHLRHVWYAARAARLRAGRWTFAVMAVVVLAATPPAGNMWPRAYASLAVSAVLVLPGSRSLPRAGDVTESIDVRPGVHPSEARS